MSLRYFIYKTLLNNKIINVDDSKYYISNNNLIYSKEHLIYINLQLKQGTYAEIPICTGIRSKLLYSSIDIDNIEYLSIIDVINDNHYVQSNIDYFLNSDNILCISEFGFTYDEKSTNEKIDELDKLIYDTKIKNIFFKYRDAYCKKKTEIKNLFQYITIILIIKILIFMWIQIFLTLKKNITYQN